MLAAESLQLLGGFLDIFGPVAEMVQPA